MSFLQTGQTHSTWVFIRGCRASTISWTVVKVTSSFKRATVFSMAMRVQCIVSADDAWSSTEWLSRPLSTAWVHEWQKLCPHSVKLVISRCRDWSSVSVYTDSDGERRLSMHLFGSSMMSRHTPQVIAFLKCWVSWSTYKWQRRICYSGQK